MIVNAYIMFDGRCEEAFDFYQRCLGGRIEAKVRYADMPEIPPMEEAEGKRIAHTRLVADGWTLMGSDIGGPYRHRPFEGPKGFYLSITEHDPERARAIFDALAQDASEVLMPLSETSWAKLFGQVADKFGVRWMVNCER